MRRPGWRGLEVLFFPLTCARLLVDHPAFSSFDLLVDGIMAMLPPVVPRPSSTAGYLCIWRREGQRLGLS
ncbi:hypothetical protein CPAR01_09003 [Colletotrichum paranaense]|uniref:Uncharacterized protein n=3 Tax=Colletotrichum acutatum species complex TaxID=2707335 RepID=A0AAI9Z8W5_9PEZI|nr:uncharacterized protein CCOS01_02289 [Colletotrichum costaricense]XP_060347399.1 uncharacterized protein CPAR01_09003 [Colletotrichum paranaense]XP_060387463.1 uncharacterized protein CTAM01_01889 [Colletotrichum tamarilloi]XP_060406236.1 uncharacterized protein CABS01_00340 [Colletotrichum abscissum]KAK1509766.1 hypothetical protein CTAM01_01889 [Colletotrichum tamarilloi]KAK1525251.1 hypothetical protein CABS01_00340 [Colletotrichum abscissum]KAK1535461.1 hypothetical protein CPAR01_0900